MPIEDTLLQKLQRLRRVLHQYPEISGKEEKTASRIKDFITDFNPDETITGLGGHGVMFVFEGKEPGPTVMIRAELDGLPIAEINDLTYRSEYNGKGHLCGHDGHMAMVAGLAELMEKERPLRGRVALLFQPAEETGEGSVRVVNDKNFKPTPDYIFALHNLPGFPKHSIVARQDVFAAASKGLIIELEGKTSHAGEPENGISPAAAVAEIIKKIEGAPQQLEGLKDYTLTTVVHVFLGRRAFGVTPGKGTVMATIRAYHDSDLVRLDEGIRNSCEKIAKEYRLGINISDTEAFSSTINDAECSDIVKDCAREQGLPLIEQEYPFRWSEDFGLFTQKYKGAMFGLGSGEDTPDLHNPDYNFPDDITTTGVQMFYNIIIKLLNKQ